MCPPCTALAAWRPGHPSGSCSAGTLRDEAPGQRASWLTLAAKTTARHPLGTSLSVACVGLRCPSALALCCIKVLVLALEPCLLREPVTWWRGGVEPRRCVPEGLVRRSPQALLSRGPQHKQRGLLRFPAPAGTSSRPQDVLLTVTTSQWRPRPRSQPVPMETPDTTFLGSCVNTGPVKPYVTPSQEHGIPVRASHACVICQNTLHGHHAQKNK